MPDVTAASGGTSSRTWLAGWRALRPGITLGLVAVLVSFALSACGSSPGMAPGSASVVSAPVRIAHGIGRTQPLIEPLTIDAMADQTSALIDTLGLGRPDVLGWSMGGMIAQALAVLHPAQVRRLVLCATFPGTSAVVPSQAARRAGSDFPANQVNAYDAFKAAISEYPAAPAPSAATKTAQAGAVTDWWDGTDAAGRKIARISVPTLIADGTADRLDPVANDHALARLIPRARLVLYPDAGHGFLFQEGTRFASLIESFLTGHPTS